MHKRTGECNHTSNCDLTSLVVLVGDVHVHVSNQFNYSVLILYGGKLEHSNLPTRYFF